MRRSADFTAAVRHGRRARRGSLVVHRCDGPDSSRPALVGFVVGRGVGGSVVRHRVTRRLRALMAARLDRLPAGSAVVVRALPPSAEASSAALATDQDAALDRVARRAAEVAR